ncbi:MAG: hypothetical protein GKR94_31190 [Gammaproteobacteria bacterium]|nr:hypothetical protein [Gammaproteobacteria bacterium]
MLLPKGRVVLISGASRGIGWAVVQHLYSVGYHLSLGVRDVGAVAAQHRIMG